MRYGEIVLFGNEPPLSLPFARFPKRRFLTYSEKRILLHLNVGNESFLEEIPPMFRHAREILLSIPWRLSCVTIVVDGPSFFFYVDTGIPTQLSVAIPDDRWYYSDFIAYNSVDIVRGADDDYPAPVFKIRPFVKRRTGRRRVLAPEPLEQLLDALIGDLPGHQCEFSLGDLAAFRPLPFSAASRGRRKLRIYRWRAEHARNRLGRCLLVFLFFFFVFFLAPILVLTTLYYEFK